MRPVSAERLHTSMAAQFEEPTWQGFELRPFDAHDPTVGDPWGLDIHNPHKILFQKPADQATEISEFRETLLSGVRPALMENQSWEELTKIFEDVYTNPDLNNFLEERRGNLVVVLPHLVFIDLGYAAGASMETRMHLPASNLFADKEDPAANQTIVAGRILANVTSPLLGAAVNHNLPLLEGFMLPIADVMTTYSSQGSGVKARLHLGQEDSRRLANETIDEMKTMMTRGGNIIFVAPSGTQAKQKDIAGDYSPVLQIPKASKGTCDLLTIPNVGDPLTQKNVFVGIGIDSSPMKDGVPASPKASVGVCPELWVPTTPTDVHLIMRALAWEATLWKMDGTPAVRYGDVGDPTLTRKQLHRLGAITLTDLRDAAA